MKKLCLFSAVLLLLLAVLGLSACGGDEDGKKGKNEESIVVTYYLTENGKPIKISVFDGEFRLAKTPTRTGYVFLGLFDSPSGGSMIVDEKGNCLVNITHSITLYAQWSTKSYTVEFDAGEATLPSGSETLTVEYGGTVHSLPTLTLQGYDFVGWKNAKGTMVSDGGTVLSDFRTFNAENYAIEDDKVVLTAVFTVQQLTVTFDFNNGTYETQTLTVDYGTALSDEQYPTQDTGTRRITGWSTYPNGNNVFSGEITSNITLYAIWKNYKIVQLDDGEGHRTPIYVYENEIFDLAGYDGVARPGEEVAGWYKNNFYSGAPVESLSYGTALDVYYAKWQEATYTLTFDYQSAGQSIPSKTYKYGDAFALPTLTKFGYDFMGWCTKADFSDTPITAVTAQMWKSYTLYAKFVPHTFTVTLMPEKGTVSTSTVTVSYEQSFTLPIPKRAGATFLGWFDEGGRKYTDARGASIGGYSHHENLTLYAHWQVQTFTVTYDPKGGTAVSPQTYEYGDRLTFPAAPTKPNYYFVGWFNADGTVPYNTDQQITENRTLYAKWGDKRMTEAYSASAFTSIMEGAVEYNGNYYKVFHTKMKWASAKAFCEGVKGHLATITTAEENQFVYQLLRDAGQTDAHLGASDVETEGVWKWVTGEAWSYTSWEPGEPNGKTGENYLGYYSKYKNGNWNDSGSDAVFICEWESDVVDYVRDNYGTVSSSDVNFNNSFYYAGHLYKIFLDYTTYDYSQAKSYCERLGGHLADISDSKENLALFAYVAQNKAWDAVFGLTDKDSEGHWIWSSTGKTPTYKNWASGQPDNASSKEHYGHFWGETANGQWNDWPWRYDFICEWDYWET